VSRSYIFGTFRRYWLLTWLTWYRLDTVFNDRHIPSQFKSLPKKYNFSPLEWLVNFEKTSMIWSWTFVLGRMSILESEEEVACFVTQRSEVGSESQRAFVNSKLISYCAHRIRSFGHVFLASCNRRGVRRVRASVGSVVRSTARNLRYFCEWMFRLCRAPRREGLTGGSPREGGGLGGVGRWRSNRRVSNSFVVSRRFVAGIDRLRWFCANDDCAAISADCFVRRYNSVTFAFSRSTDPRYSPTLPLRVGEWRNILYFVSRRRSIKSNI